MSNNLSEKKEPSVLSYEHAYTITGFLGDLRLIERLKNLGFLEQKNFKIKSQISFGGPIVVEIDSSTFALRKNEFACLRFERCKK